MKKVDDKAKEARNAYMREWRKNNKKKVKEANERYWAKKAKAQEQEGEKGEKRDG